MLILRLEDEYERGPLSREGLGPRTLPFAGAVALAFATSPVSETQYGAPFWGAVAITLLMGATVVLAPWERLPTDAQIIPVLLFLVVVVLLRHSLGGAESGFAPLLLLPTVWTGLYGTPRQLAVAVLGIAVGVCAPVLFFGSPAYPPSEWRRALLLIPIAGAIGLAIKSLVTATQAGRELREQVAARALLEKQAAKIYEDVTERLTTAKMALQHEDQQALAIHNLSNALEAAERITDELLRHQPEIEAGTTERRHKFDR